MKFRMLHGDGLTGFGYVEHEVHVLNAKSSHKNEGKFGKNVFNPHGCVKMWKSGKADA